jgi:hypothetical protein
VGLLLPNEMGIATSGLGLENCALSMLEELGPDGCPANSVMGLGAATAEVPISSDPVSERARVEIFSAPVVDGHLGLLVYAEGVSPIFAQLVFPGAVLPARSPFGEDVETELPLVPSVPGAADVAITAFQARLGSAAGYDHFLYRKRVHGWNLPYTPRGLILPPSCPRGGFPFKAELGFQDQTVAVARTTVACPRRKGERQTRGRA